MLTRYRPHSLTGWLVLACAVYAAGTVAMILYAARLP